MSDRLEHINRWLQSVIATADYKLEAASADASFRRYFRVNFNKQSLIIMDAPPAQENSGKFIAVAELLAGFGLNVPEIKARDLANGFLLLTDLGDRLYLSELSPENVERLYGDAMGALITLQTQAGSYDLPEYDQELILRELEIFREWYLARHLNIALSDELNQAINSSYDFLAQSALEQPRVIVHRDYHSRNLLVTRNHNPGILDFQDAVIGPVTYDLVSLLRDCYIAWPDELVRNWAEGYYALCLQSGVFADVGKQDFLRWFDLMGIQRHLKAAGIFARLNYRDNKPGYLHDIPRTLNYVSKVGADYPALRPITDLLNRHAVASQ